MGGGDGSAGAIVVVSAPPLGAAAFGASADVGLADGGAANGSSASGVPTLSLRSLGAADDAASGDESLRAHAALSSTTGTRRAAHTAHRATDDARPRRSGTGS
jgi:hypothetical protein